MIEYNNGTYDLYYTIKRCELIEKALGKSISAALIDNNAMMTIKDMRAFYGYGLKEEGGNYMPAAFGGDVLEHILKTDGYVTAVTMIQEAVSRDVPFLLPRA